MALSVEQQRSLTSGIGQAQQASSAGGTTVTRGEAADVVAQLLKSGVSPADVRAAVASSNIDTTTRTAFAAALASRGTGLPRDYASATRTAAGRTLHLHGTLPFLRESDIPSEVTPEGMQQLQNQQAAVIERARAALREGHDAMVRGDYRAAARAYTSVGLPVGSDVDITNASPENIATLVLTGVYRVGNDGSVNPIPGAHPERSPTFRTINGMAARAELLGDMAAKGVSPSNPPSQADIAAYLAAAGQRHSSDPQALMSCVARVENGTLIHYRASDSSRDISYRGGYPTSWSDVEAQTEVGGRRRADCQLEAMVWFESARMAGMTPVGIVAVEASGPGRIGHAMAVVQSRDGRMFLCSGDGYREIPRGGSGDSRIRSAVSSYYNDTFGHRPGTVHIGHGSDIETASHAAYPHS